MSIDPAAPAPSTIEARLSAQIGALARRVQALERNPPAIPVTTGAPGINPRAGGAVVDDGAPAGTIRLGLYVPSRGGFKWTTLT